MKVLLSIKPEFVERIFSGEKLFEYRKAIFKRPDVTSIVIYSTMPEGKIVGEFSIDHILERTPEVLWQETKSHSGIDKNFFDEYFSNRDKAYAIKIKKLKRYEKPIDPYTWIEKFTAPQSFKYIDSDFALNN